MTLSLLLALTLAQFAPNQNPLGIPRRGLYPDGGTTTYPQHMFLQTDGGVTADAIGCVKVTRGADFECLAWLSDVPTAPTAPQVFLAPASSPPSGTRAVGDSYYDTLLGCLRTWSGSAWTPATCPITSIPAQPVPPNTLLSPAASDPSTSTTGATYFNTSGRCLKSWNGASWSPSACPSTAVASTPSASTPPVGTTAGDRFWDSTQGCTRVYNGTSWGDCSTGEKCITVSTSGLSIPLAGITTVTTLSFPGAVTGRSCRSNPPSRLPLGAKAECRVSAAGSIEYWWEAGGLLSTALAIPNGTHSLCTQVNQ